MALEKAQTLEITAEESSALTRRELVTVNGSWRQPYLVIVIVGLIGVFLTLSVSWGAYVLNRRNEHRLLQVQTEQAQAVVAATVLAIRDPLVTAVQVAVASGGNALTFDRYISNVVGPSGLFVSAGLVTLPTGKVIAARGAASWLSLTSTAGLALIQQATHSATFVVTSLHRGRNERIGYAVSSGNSNPTFVVYAERAIPPDRQVAIEKNSAFSDLNYATYLGPAAAQNLATTDVRPSDLPLKGYVTRAVVPFGNSQITLVAAARGDLGGSLGTALPWMLLPGGLLVAASVTLLGAQLARRRRRAEEHAFTITELYKKLDGLYGEQRTIAEALQQALLPASHPTIPGLNIASRYVAGGAGVDIGGDWYSVIELPGGRFGFVVGDVSGRGVSAATLMARIRFTLRAYLAVGYSPAEVLSMCAEQIDIERDGHFATALVGVGDTTTGEVHLANAGHLNPVLLVDGQAEFVSTVVGLPLGTGTGVYETSNFIVPPGGVLLGYTDGLVERRGEHLELGLGRLMVAATTARQEGLDEILTDLLTTLVQAGAEDDVAILGLQRTTPDRNELQRGTQSADDQPVGT